MRKLSQRGWMTCPRVNSATNHQGKQLCFSTAMRHSFPPGSSVWSAAFRTAHSGLTGSFSPAPLTVMSVTALHSSLPGSSHPPSRLRECNSTCSGTFESSPSVNQPSSIHPEQRDLILLQFLELEPGIFPLCFAY